MNRIANLLNAQENILLDVDVASRKRLFEAAAKVISTTAGVPAQTVFDGLIAREKLGSTGLGSNAAIPHTRLGGLVEPSLCLIRTKEPIAYEGANQSTAQLFFVVAIPENAAEDYLAILAEVAGFLCDPLSREALLQAKTPSKALEAIAIWSPASH